MDKKFILSLLVLALGAVGVYYLNTSVEDMTVKEVSSFEECVAAGNPVLRSIPEKCATPDGNMFTKMPDEERPAEPTIPPDATAPTPGPNMGPKPDEQVACTMDAMQCPDGSYVGRTGPNCEFICPAN